MDGAATPGLGSQCILKKRIMLTLARVRKVRAASEWGVNHGVCPMVGAAWSSSESFKGIPTQGKEEQEV
jgi:hypothetical protein